MQIACFNPCFVGNRSGRKLNKNMAQLLQGFNPCFVGNRSGSERYGNCTEVCNAFQSLFCWKSVWEWLLLVDSWKWFVVSILVLLEIGLGAGCIGFLPMIMKRFNPCFVGNRSGRLKHSNLKRMTRCFNPCFVGNRSGRNHSYFIQIWLIWVSILVLLEIGLGVKAETTLERICIRFNPCFVGNRSGRLHLLLTE